MPMGSKDHRFPWLRHDTNLLQTNEEQGRRATTNGTYSQQEAIKKFPWRGQLLQINVSLIITSANATDIAHRK